MKINDTVAQGVSRAVKELYGVETPWGQIEVAPTRKEFEGNVTVVVFPWVKAAHKAPQVVAQEIGQWLVAHEPEVARFNVVKGFLNIVIKPTYWDTVLERILATKDYGTTAPTETSPLVMVEYSSPNTNKPLHLGHVRNNLLGFSLSQILEACGNRVVRTNIVNDRGIHICKSMLAWQKWGEGATPQSTGKKGDHLVGDYYVKFNEKLEEELRPMVLALGGSPKLRKEMTDEEKAQYDKLKDQVMPQSQLLAEAHQMLVKWEQADPEVRALWEKMNRWVYDGFDATYRRLGVRFDKIYYESQTYLDGKAKVLEGLEKGIFERHADQSVWADLTDAGLDQKLLLRADGTSVYMTQDIGTAQQRFRDYPIDRMIYVVGNEQNYHFQVLSLLLDRLGFAWGKDLVHFSYGMVELPDGKMKSREGTVVDADVLMNDMVEGAREVSRDLGKLDGLEPAEIDAIAETVGLGALKYFLLKVDPRKNMLFNPQESIDFNGNTGPFIQYTYARIRSVLRKAEEQGFKVGDYSTVEPNEREVAVIQMLADFPEVVQEAGRSYSPALIANYTYDLVKLYNQFYHDCPILRESDAGARSLRLALCRGVANVVHTAMGLLGIAVPERM